MPTTPTTNTLFYGDNLDILREYISDASIDLIYLDPPFNSARNFNVLFKDERVKRQTPRSRHLRIHGIGTKRRSRHTAIFRFAPLIALVRWLSPAVLIMK